MLTKRIFLTFDSITVLQKSVLHHSVMQLQVFFLGKLLIIQECKLVGYYFKK